MTRRDRGKNNQIELHEKAERQTDESVRVDEGGPQNSILELENAKRALKRVRDELELRMREQAAVAQISQRALSTADLSALLQEACTLVAQTIGVEFCKVLELLPAGQVLRLRAGVGWKEGLIGRATVGAGVDSQAGYTLLCGKPVIVEDLRTETRFSGPPLLGEHGIVSGISVIIAGRDRPFGVLGAHTAARRSFSEHEVHLLEAVANVLSGATEHRRAESWLRKLIDTTQDAVVSIDRGARIVLFNAAAEKMFAYTAAEVTGQKVNILMAEPYASDHDNYIARYERTGERRAIGTIRTVMGRRNRGEIFPIELSVTEIDESNSDVRYGAFIRDISDKAQLQAQLVEKARLAAIDETTAKLAHEIANPLNGMAMSIQLLERRLTEFADETIKLTLKRISNEVSRLKTLLSEFRTLSARETYDFRPTQLAEIAEEICSMEREKYVSKGIRLEVEVQSGLPLVLADRAKIKQLLLNLCKNAEEAMVDGGTLTIRAQESGGNVIVELRDTGVGIAKGIDIFEPFKTTKASGTGLGLVIGRQIVSRHNGSLSYISEPGKGTSFFLTLPAYSPS